jgi:ketosteroid isomerase-like protein
MTPAIRRYPAHLFSLALFLFAVAVHPTLHAQQSDAPSAEPVTAVQQFQQFEDKWSIAYAHKDQFDMELILSPSFVNVSAAGQVSTRNELIAQMFDHSAGDLLSMEQRVVNVRIFGDVALVEGTYIIHYKLAAHTYDERGVFTHVYERARNNWICVNAQRTAVYDQSDEKAKNAGKKSNAALPLHIPLLYKGATPVQSAQTPSGNPPPQQ